MSFSSHGKRGHSIRCSAPSTLQGQKRAIILFNLSLLTRLFKPAKLTAGSGRACLLGRWVTSMTRMSSHHKSPRISPSSNVAPKSETMSGAFFPPPCVSASEYWWYVMISYSTSPRFLPPRAEQVHQLVSGYRRLNGGLQVFRPSRTDLRSTRGRSELAWRGDSDVRQRDRPEDGGSNRDELQRGCGAVLRRRWRMVQPGERE